MINLSEYRNVHCIGIGGIGLSAIAEILISRGYKVSGSDMKRSEITDSLTAKGADIYINHRKENVENAEFIIYSAAISEENPEMIRAKELNIPMAGRAEVLGMLMEDFKNSIAISGTHGKTTTTSMVSLILEDAKLSPTILVGGNLDAIGGNVKGGSGEYFVTEACEYRDSFLELYPKIEVILNIDSDHLDYFKDIDHIVQSFTSFTDNLKDGGKIIAYGENPFVAQVIENNRNVITYGYGKGCDYLISNIKFGSDGMPSFDIIHKNEKLGRLSLIIPGEHNILNATAAFACCHQLGVQAESIINTLKTFVGSHRRFDVLGKTGKGTVVIDDYAHHPTEIKATLSATAKLPHHRVWCLFQPHTYTRTLALFDEFAQAFERADVLILADIYAAREKNIFKVTSENLGKRIKEMFPDKEVIYMPDFTQMTQYVNEHAQREDLVITMGAGDIYRVGNMLIEA